MAQPLSQLKFRPRPSTSKIILHDTGTTPYQSGIEHFLARKGRELGLLEIGYHYLVRPTGDPVACRPIDAVGAHCKGYNHNSIGIALIGGMDYPPDVDHLGPANMVPTDTFPEAQIAGVVFLCRYIMETLGYGELDVLGHSELPRYAMGHRQCPMTDVQAIRNQLGGTQWGTQ